ncbi:SdiA-regulated domain-containing protein [Rhodovulum sp. YNF3179]
MTLWPLPGRTDAGRADPPRQLTYIGSYPFHQGKAGLKEPSGLTLDPVSGGFLTVSDDSRHVFRTDDAGKVTGVLPKIDGLSDPEGIALAPGTGRRLILAEEDAAIFAVDAAPPYTVQRRALLEIPGSDMLRDALGGDPGRLGPEGITVDPVTGTVWVVNERAPRLLVELSPGLDEIRAVTALTSELGFVSRDVADARLDVSGLAHDRRRGGIWMSSDTGKCLFFWPRRGGPAHRFDLLWQDGEDIRRIDNAEGVTLNAAGDRLFVVSDDGKDSRFFVYGID